MNKPPYGLFAVYPELHLQQQEGRAGRRARLLGGDGSLEGSPDLKGLLGPGIPPSRPGSCPLATFPPRGRLAYSCPPDPSLTARRTPLPGPAVIPPSISGITPSISCFSVLRLTGGQPHSSQSRALEIYFLLHVKTITFHLTQWERNSLNAALRRTGQRPHVQLNCPAGNAATQPKNLKCSGSDPGTRHRTQEMMGQVCKTCARTQATQGGVK